MAVKAEAVNQGADGRKVLSRLKDEQWLELCNRLDLFINSYYFGVESGDLINEAIIGVMEGRRRSWDLTKSPFSNLCSIIRSIASNQFVKEKRLTPLNENVETSPSCDAALASPSDHSQAEMYERREEDQRFSARLHRKIGKDSLLHRIADYLMETPRWKPTTIAGDLGVEKKDVDNARKRLVRTLRALSEEENEAL